MHPDINTRQANSKKLDVKFSLMIRLISILWKQWIGSTKINLFEQQNKIEAKVISYDYIKIIHKKFVK